MPFTPRDDTNYYSNLRAQIRGNEGAVYSIYHPDDYVPTIGYGYTFIRFNGVRWDIYEQLDADLAAIGRPLSTQQRDMLRSIVNARNDGRNGEADALIGQLSGDFGAINPNDPDLLFEREANQQALYLRRRMRNVLGTAAGNALYERLSGSVEMRALLDIAYFRGAGNVNEDLIRAMNDDNRAEAWFQVRYQSIPTNPQPGHITRIYRDADLFGLYDTPGTATATEALQVYRMLQLHRSAIAAYESTYPPPATVEALAAALGPARSQLVSDLQAQYAALSTSHVQAIAADRIFLDPGRRSPNASIEPNHDVTLDSTRRNAQGGEIASDDLLVGEGGRDTLIAGLGNDILIGGIGHDTLQGGAGNDVYVFDRDEGDDTIRDADGTGSIRVGSTLLSGLESRSFIHQVFIDRPAWRWTTAEGRDFDFVLVDGDLANGGTLWIEGDGVGLGSRILVENFRQGDLGLFFPVNPQLQLLPNYPGIQGPFADANYQPTTLSTTLREGQSRTLTLALNMPARAGQAVRLSVNQLGSALAIVTGPQTLPLSNGYVDVVLDEGRRN